MRNRVSSVALVILPGMFLGGLIMPASAQLSAWLDFDGKLKGEATDPKHRDWIDIEGFNIGSSRAITSGAVDREAGRPLLSELSLFKYVDAATPGLFGAVTAGDIPYLKVTLDLGTRESVTFARLELHDVLLTGQTFNGSSGDTKPTESITLNFTKITYTYIQPDSKTLWATYDIAKNVAASGAGDGGGAGGGGGGGGGDPDPDSDGDGMPDSWEATYGLNGSSNDGIGDLDGDGLTNLQEFQLGTNPKSGTSFFKAELTPVGGAAGGFDLRWNSVAGKIYVIEWSPDLKTPFTTLRTVTATASSTTENVTNAGNIGFYRVRPQ